MGCTKSVQRRSEGDQPLSNRQKLKRSNKTEKNAEPRTTKCSNSIDITPESKTSKGKLQHYAAADMRTSVDTLNIRKMRSSSPQTGAFETSLSDNDNSPFYEEDMAVKRNKKLRSFSFSSVSDSEQLVADTQHQATPGEAG